MKKQIFRSTRHASTLCLPREQGFFDKSLAIKLIISFIFIILLFFILHFRDMLVIQLEQGSLSSQLVVSPIDFDFYDEDAVVLLQQEANRDIGAVYQIDPDEIHDRRINLEKFLIFNQDWRKHIEYSTFEELYNGVEKLESVLLRLRFTDIRTYRRMRQEKLETKDYMVAEAENFDNNILLPSRIWDQVSEIVHANDTFQKSAINYIVDSFKNEKWRLKENEDNRLTLTKIIHSNISPHYGHIKAGQTVIKKGDIVNHRHLIIIKAMKEAILKGRNLYKLGPIMGSALLASLIMFIGWLFLRVRFHDVLYSNRKLFLLYIILGMMMLLAKGVEYILHSLPPEIYSSIKYPIIVPFMSILLCNLMNMELAIVLTCFVVMLFSHVLVMGDSFMQVNLIASLGAVLSIKPLRNRRRILEVSVKAWLLAIAIITAISLYKGAFNLNTIVLDYGISLAFIFFIAILVIGILPVIETIFPIMTDAVLMEYMDPNNEILSRLVIEASGTYQHSIVVGTLAESAAQAIGANSLFCRVAAMYHDIGKLRNPQYFIENQNQNQGVNMHQLLTPIESAKVIIDHVSEGVAMARKAGLPEQFIDIIKEHHGDTVMQFFYKKHLEKNMDLDDNINKNNFRYFGPKPRSKEAAIIMIADSFEAASRSLKEVDEASTTKLLNDIIKDKAGQGQLDECMLTFEELGVVRKALVKTMLTASHARIKY